MAPTYTPESANALLPELAPALVELRQRLEEAARLRGEVAQAAQSNGGGVDRGGTQEVLARIEELMGRIDAWGLILRDVGSGLVDFPAEIEGSEAFLCWRLGEAEVAFWHPTDEGFGGRRPLPE